MDRRAFLLGSAGLTASWLLPSRLVLAQAGSREDLRTADKANIVRRFVRDYQEKAYVRLADDLGLSSAKSAYEKIAGRKMPPDLVAKYGSETLPTPFEDPFMFQIMTKTFDDMSRENDTLSAVALPHPFLATLASGDVEANVEEEPATKTPILFFEHGLFSFFKDIADLMAWAAPALTEGQLTDDTALARLARRYTMPLQASENFFASLYAYAVNGSPAGTSSPIPLPSQNLGLAIRLLNHMVRFVMAHELAHVREGHYKTATPTWSQEYEADSLAVSLVTTLAEKNHGSWAVGYWGSELALVALNFLYRAIALFTFGPGKPTWINQTHPDPLRRRENLRGIWLNSRSPQAGVDAAREVCGMMEGLFSRLWDISRPLLLVQYQRGARASPRWKKTAKSFAADNS